MRFYERVDEFHRNISFTSDTQPPIGYIDYHSSYSYYGQRLYLKSTGVQMGLDKQFEFPFAAELDYLTLESLLQKM